MKNSNILVVLLSSLLAASAAQAEKADRDKPMNIEADALRYDDLKQTSVFTGRVVATKGTLVIRGARLDVRQDPEGYQYGVVTAEPGKLAHYRQKREGLDEYIEGEGETIEYDSRADLVRLLRHAQIRRYKGAALNDEVNGSLIVYENGTDMFSVDASTPGAASRDNPGGRVRAMLTPQNRAEPLPPASIAPAAPAPAPAPGATLRPSLALGEEKK